MALHFSPRLVSDGLIVLLDSMDIVSYPGSGTVWYDLSGYGHNANLYNMNSPSSGNTSGYDTTTKYMMFDRHLGGGDGTVNNYASIPNTSILDQALCENGMTIDMWIRETSSVCTAITRWSNTWELYYCPTLTFRTMGTGGTDGGSSAGTSPGTWRNVVATHDGVNRKMYVNTGLVLNDTNNVYSQDTSSPIAIGAYDSGIYATNGAIPIYRIYNRALSSTEITQNYNATKNRFGL
jgi:hypothetical protein